VKIKRPMLAATANDLDKLKFPVIASPKLDGFRCIMLSGKALSRSFKQIANVYTREYMESRFPDNLDGELILPGKSFNDISSELRKFEGEPDFEFHVFDYIDLNEQFVDRLKIAEEVVVHTEDPRIKIVPSKLINNVKELLQYEEKCLDEGHEGVMIRSLDGLYKEGRSTERQGWLLKLKRFKDSEAEILGFEEQMHNNNAKKTNEIGLSSRSTSKENMIPADTLGKFLVKDIYSGIEFAIGSGEGLTAGLRKEIWYNQSKYLGEIVKYKYQLIGMEERPRIPIWLGFRPREDM